MILRLVLLLALGSSFLAPQKKSADEVCPWCQNDPQVMAKAGVVSHGKEYRNS
jgi:hypothetical protein